MIDQRRKPVFIPAWDNPRFWTTDKFYEGIFNKKKKQKKLKQKGKHLIRGVK